MSIRSAFLRTYFLFFFLVIFAKAHAIVSTNLSLTMITGPVFHSDQNDCVSGLGPRAVYVGIEICNTGLLSQDNIAVTLTGFSATGYSLAGGQYPTQSIRSPLLPGACDTLFWFCTYPCGASTTSILFNVLDVDDGSSFKDTVHSISSLRELSANSGGFITASKVSLRDSINRTDCFIVYYGLSKLDAGDQVFLQPAANLDFKANCYQLDHATVLNSEADSPGCIPVGPCPLYYEISSSCGSSPIWVVTVEYCFKVQCVYQYTAIVPYASATSGNDLKYTIASTPIYLPIELVEFRGKVNGSTVDVIWSVLNEKDLAYYELERSTDALTFEKLETVSILTATAPLPIGTTYTYTDVNPITKNYYRLKMVELDGNVNYSDVIQVDFQPDRDQQYVLFPNPTCDRLKVRLAGSNALPPVNMIVELLDLSGQRLTLDSLILTEGEIDVSLLLPGTYFVRLKSDDWVSYRKFIKH